MLHGLCIVYITFIVLYYLEFVQHFLVRELLLAMVFCNLHCMHVYIQVIIYKCEVLDLNVSLYNLLEDSICMTPNSALSKITILKCLVNFNCFRFYNLYCV